MTDFPEMTPAQSIKFMLTLPWMMGDTSDEGATYDESEIETVLDYVRQIEARADAAEADARECRAERARYGDMMTEKLAAVEADRIAARALAFRMRRERDAARDEYRLLVERVKAVMPYAINTAAWVTLLATIGVEPEDMHFSK